MAGEILEYDHGSPAADPEEEKLVATTIGDGLGSQLQILGTQIQDLET